MRPPRMSFADAPALALAVSLWTASGLLGQELLLVGGQVVDPAAREVRSENLLLRDGMIVGTPAEVPDGFSGEVLDVEGRWIIPGLVELHTHSFGNAAPVEGVTEFLGTPVVSLRMLYAGVTAFLDLFSLEDQILSLRDSQRENPPPGADIFAAGPCMTTPGGHCSEYGVPTRLMSTPREARRQVAELAEKRPDVVKIVYSQHGRMPSMDRATMAAAVEAATAHGIPTIIHIDSWDDVRDAAIAGATAVTHVPGSDPIPDDVLDLLVARGVSSIPTLAVQLGVTDLTSDPGLLEAPLARAVTSDAILRAYRSGPLMASAAQWRERQIEQRSRVLDSVRRMHEAGVPILVGTDSGNLGTIQGWSVHHELMKLVEAGLDPWDALAAGTTHAAAFLGQRYGVSEGSAADLVVLEASPIDDIRNTQRIVDVIHRGERVDRQALITP